MSRDVDRVIDYIKTIDDIPPVHRQIMINRLDPPPSKEELALACEQVYPSTQEVSHE